MIATRIEQLTAYQNAAYARRYQALVDKVRVAEQSMSDALASDLPLTATTS